MLLDSVLIQIDFRKTFCGGQTRCPKLRDIDSKQRHRVFSASQQAGFDQESLDNPVWKLMWRWVIALRNISKILNYLTKIFSEFPQILFWDIFHDSNGFWRVSTKYKYFYAKETPFKRDLDAKAVRIKLDWGSYARLKTTGNPRYSPSNLNLMRVCIDTVFSPNSTMNCS